jgi:2'-5' RNA ligase
MIRAFLAVQLSEPLRTTLAAVQSEVKRRITHELPRDVSLSWVRPAAMHLTVKFLGDIPEELVIPLREGITGALAEHRIVQVPLDRLGAFPRLQQPRVLWIGPTEQWETTGDAGRLAAVHRAVEACCATLNLAPDTRSLTAHLTLARIKAGHRAAAQILARSGVMDRLPSAVGSLTIDAIALVRSELKPSGSVYTVLWESKLLAA